MYSEDILKTNNFFDDLINKEGYYSVIDSLTKVLSRQPIIDYTNYLISNNENFSLLLIDMDNFKLINDNYGHAIGDFALSLFAESLQSYIGDNGYVGRYGGDEFIVVLKEKISYDDVHEYLQKMMNSKKVTRRYYKLENAYSFVTASIGSVSFPTDGKDYDELFNKADKALYRGKIKGRNCFIIYLDSKHKNIDISKIARNPEYITFKKIEKDFTKNNSIERNIVQAFDTICSSLRNSGIYYLNMNKKLIYKNSEAPEIPNDFSNVDLEDILFGNDLLHTNNFDVLLAKDPELHDICRQYHINAIMITSVRVLGMKLGYLIFTENKIKRMWQDEEVGLLIYVATLLGISIEKLDLD